MTNYVMEILLGFVNTLDFRLALELRRKTSNIEKLSSI